MWIYYCHTGRVSRWVRFTADKLGYDRQAFLTGTHHSTGVNLSMPYMDRLVAEPDSRLIDWYPYAIPDAHAGLQWVCWLPPNPSVCKLISTNPLPPKKNWLLLRLPIAEIVTTRNVHCILYSVYISFKVIDVVIRVYIFDTRVWLKLVMKFPWSKMCRVGDLSLYSLITVEQQEAE